MRQEVPIGAKRQFGQILLKESGQEIFMNDLLNNLHPHYPMSTTNRSELLKQISGILGTTSEIREKEENCYALRRSDRVEKYVHACIIL